MVKLVELIPDIEQSHYPQLDGSLCVHGMLADASCRACISSCPRDAWELTDEALEIATDACDSCGICIPACPQEALSLPIEPTIRYHDSERIGLMACDRAVESDQAGAVPCIHRFGTRELLDLHAGGIRKWVVATGDCSDCPRDCESTFEKTVEFLGTALKQRGHDTILQQHLPVGKWISYRDSLSDTDPSPVSRRQFFRRIAITGTDSLEAESEEAAKGHLLEGEGLVPWHCSIDSDRCDLCEACHKLCPTEAIRLEKVGTMRLIVDSSRCNGCMLCKDVCDDAAAVTVRPWEQSGIQEIVCEERQCSACGVGYLSLPDDSGTKCGICRRIDHRRNLFQTLS